MVLVHWFVVRSPNPIQYVKRPISTHEENKVPCKILYLTIALQNNELRKYGDGLQVDGKSPQQLQQLEPLNSAANEMCDSCNNCTWGNSESPMKECILRFVIRRADWFLEADHIDNRSSRHNVKDLHTRIVQRIECREQIQIASDENDEEELIRSERDPLSVLRNPQSK
eukprot:CAMPEP_0197448736 /NCGR_PEP_ID=MMETSP1175-20131217/18693_1 /TAXON_ID=1003142 /ORGANISM="Triceratium dubium, Strain CCMP147" /LENGTH=168 /DNA_ID=CAMNT_0042980609 /DNA_START=560 /DNA_END=1066 /DNA_ORIENTATION=-